MHAKALIRLGGALFIASVSAYACGGSTSPSAPAPTPTPTPTTGTFAVKGATSVTGALSTRSLIRYAAAPQMLPGTPTSLRVKALKVFLSANADCSSPVLVQDKGGAADYQDLIGKPTLFSGSVTPGSYPCVILKVSDIMKFTPDGAAQTGSAGVCVAGRENDFDILKNEDPPEQWYDVDSGATITGAGSYGSPIPQDVFIFITTNKAAVTATNSRVHGHQFVTLVNPVVIKSSQVTSGAFVFDASNRMAVVTDDRGGAWCWLEGASVQFVGQ